MFGRATIRLGIGPHSSLLIMNCAEFFAVLDFYIDWSFLA